jgi:hypothetical protein
MKLKFWRNPVLLPLVLVLFGLLPNSAMALGEKSTEP